MYIGTTGVAINRASNTLALTGVSIDGNTETVTNGVYTSGSYADPSWFTGLNATKISTGSGAVTIAAGGSNQNVTLTPSGSGYTVLNGSVGIGTSSPTGKLNVLATTEQERLAYDATHYTSMTVNSAGDLTFGGTTGVVNATTFVGALTGTASGNALPGQTMYIGTTSTAINRASAAQALTGITSIDNGTTGVTIATATTDKIGFFNATPVAQQTGNVCTALNALGLTTSCSESGGAPAFSAITTGTNTAALHIGIGGTLDATGTGTIVATSTTGNAATSTTAPTTALLATGSVAGAQSSTQAFGSYGLTSSGNVGIGTTTITGGALSVMGGNVGIGTTAPGALLHISTTGSANNLKLDSTGSGVSGLSLATDGTIKGYWALARNAGQYFTDASAGDMAFRSEANKILFGQGSGVSTMTINAGNVGIGTTTPAAALQVNGALNNAYTSLLVASNVAGATPTTFNTNGSSALAIGANRSSGQGELNIINSNYGAAGLGGIWFEQATGASTVATRMIITSSGNVGIGTTSITGLITVGGACASYSGSMCFVNGAIGKCTGALGTCTSCTAC